MSAALPSMWQRSTQNDRILLTYHGDTGTSSVIEKAFEELHEILTEAANLCYLIDIRNIDRISSQAIARLISTVRVIDMAGGRMAMVHVHPFIANILRTMRIVKVLPLFGSMSEALLYLEKNESD